MNVRSKPQRIRKPTLLQQRRMETILNEAEKYFVETGIANSKMEEIAERVGVSRQTLYRYYRTKDDLAFAVEVRVLSHILKQFTDLFPKEETTTLQDLEQVIEKTSLAFLKKEEQKIRFTALFDSYFHQYAQKRYIELMKETLAAYSNPFREIIEREQLRGAVCSSLDPVKAGEMMTHSLLSLSQRVLMRSKALKAEYDFDPNDLIPLQMKMFVRGIRCSPPEEE